MMATALGDIPQRRVGMVVLWLLLFLVTNERVSANPSPFGRHAAVVKRWDINHPFYPSAKTSLSRRRRQQEIFGGNGALQTHTNTKLVAVRQKQKKAVKQREEQQASLQETKKTPKFKPPPLLQQKKQNNKQTPIADLAHVFSDRILLRGGKEIHTARLIKACKQLERVMRRVGQRANANELSLNIHKVETVYKAAPPSQRETISALLCYERDELHIHKPGGILRDPSAAVGLLWLRRSLEFQHNLYSRLMVNTKQQQKRFQRELHEQQQQHHHDHDNVDNSAAQKHLMAPDATTASMQAYAQTLERNHGWKIKRIYLLALRTSTPSRLEMLSSLGGFSAASGDTSHYGLHEERIMERDMRQLLQVWKPLMVRWKSTFVALDLEDKRRV